MRAALKDGWAALTRRLAIFGGLGLIVLLACAAPREAPRSVPASAPQAAAPAGSGGAPVAAAPSGGSAPAASAGGAGGLPPIPAAIAVPTGGPAQLKVGMNIGASDAGFFLAMDKGYFAEQGIEIE